MSIAEFHWMGGIQFMSVLSISFTIIIGVTILNILRVSKGNYNAKHQKLNIGDIGAIGTFMSTLDGSILNVALPTIADQLQCNINIVAWVILAYSLTVVYRSRNVDFFL